MNSPKLPLTRSFSLEYRLTLFAAVIMTTLSLGGLLFPETFYPAEDLRRSFVANDVVNLFIGLPILILSLWRARSGNLVGLLFWPGALLYVAYNYLAYAAAMPFTWQFFIYLVLAALSGFAVYSLFTSLDIPFIGQCLAGKAPERLAGVVLAGLGALFFLRAVAEFFDGAAGWAEFGVIVADLITTPLWIIGGILLWRKRPLGYAAGEGLLFQASMLFIALLVYFMLQPIIAGTPFPLVDFIVILAMGLVVFVPFGLYVRAIMRYGQEV